MPSRSLSLPAVAGSFLVAFVVFTLSILAGPGASHAVERSQVELLHYSADQFAWEDGENGSTLLVEGTTPMEVTGLPALPVEATNWVVPRGWKVIGARLVDAVWEDLPSRKKLALAPVLVSTDGEEASPITDPALLKASIFPPQAVELAGTQWLAGYSIASLRVFPARRLADGRVQRLVSAQLSLDLALDENAPNSVHRTVAWPEVAERDAAFVRASVRNPARVDRFAPPRGLDPSVASVDYSVLQSGRAKTQRLYSGPVEFLILTPAAFAGEMQRLADYRNQEGMRTAVVSVEDILSSYRNGGDQQETLRLFLRQAYQTWGLQYVLLAGDSEFIAPRYARSTFYPVGGFTDIPSDLYYACLDGNWNIDADGIYAEAYQNFLSTGDQADMLAELSIGRAPVKSLAQAQLFVDKVLAYSEPADPSFVGRGLFLSEVLFPQNWDGVSAISLDGASYSESIIFNSIIGGGNLFQSWRMYENYTAYLGAIPESKVAALDSLSSGNFGLVTHEGHGFYYNMSVADGNIFVADVDQLQNAPNYFFLYALNCSSGAFDFDCLLEKYIQHPLGGAVGTAGSSRAAFPTTANAYQQDFFAEIFVNRNTRLGDAQRLSRASYVANTNVEGSHRWTHFSYILFSDPTMQLWRENPTTPLVAHLATIDEGTQTLTVTVSAGAGVQGAIVAISHPDGRMSSSVTDAAGTCILDLQGMSDAATNLSLMVSGKNLMPYHGTVAVQPGVGPHVLGTSVATIDDGSGLSVGDGDGIVDTGETIEWSFQFQNNGDGTPTLATSAKLVPVNAPGVTIVNDTVSVGAIGGGATVLPGQNFVLSLANTIPDGQFLEFDLEITEGATTWSQPVNLTAIGPEIEVARITWDDSSGNGDGIINPGEPIALTVELVNYGGGTANLVDGVITTASANVNLLVASNQWTGFGNKQWSTGNGTYQLTESNVLVENWMKLTLTDDVGHTWVHDFELRAPNPPATPVLDTSLGPTSIVLRMSETNEPHFYGYRVFRSTSPTGPFTEITNDRIEGTGVIEDKGLMTLTRYYYEVALVDSSSVMSALSSPVSASTSPPELAGGFPIPMGREASGALAVGDVLGDGTLAAMFGADFIYALKSDGSEVVDGDSDSQTLGPIAGDAANPRFTPSGITLADLDGDGADEIIGGNWDRRELWVVRGDGSDFPGWPRIMGNKNWGTPAVGDLDNDGDLEIVVNTVGKRTYVFHHDGTDFFDGDNNPATVGVFAERPGEIFNRSTPLLLDVDSDGTLEILFGTHWRDGTTDNMVHALRNDATDAPGWPKNLGPSGYSVTHMTAADLDGDGAEEITFLCDNDSMYVWEKDGSNMVGYPQYFFTQSANLDSKTPAVAFGDFDKNGDLEMVVVSIKSLHSCEIYLKDADGTTWAGWPRVLPGLSESSPLVVDINGDLSLDIIFGIGGGSDNDPNVLYAFNADGTDVEGFPMTLPGAVRAVPAVADFDLDGDVDVLYAGQDLFLHVWDMPFPYREYLAPWPTFQANNQRTGVYLQGRATAAISADVNAVPTPGGIQVEATFFGLPGFEFRVNVDRHLATEVGGAWTSVGRDLPLRDGIVRVIDADAESGRTYEYRVMDSSESFVFYSQAVFVPALRATLRGAVPNPFNPATSIQFEVPGTAGSQVPTVLQIYDLSGRLVRTLQSGPLSPGPHSVMWKGEDDSGVSVASGVYFAHLSCAGVVRSAKLTLVK